MKRERVWRSFFLCGLCGSRVKLLITEEEFHAKLAKDAKKDFCRDAVYLDDLAAKANFNE